MAFWSVAMTSRIISLCTILLSIFVFSNAQVSISEQASIAALLNAFPALEAVWVPGQEAHACDPGQVWTGLECSGYNIVKIQLSSRALVGTMPADIWANFFALTDLDMSNNDINGGLPADLLALSYLVTINLANNRLNQPLPAGAPGPNLKFLYLQNNTITVHDPQNFAYRK